MRKLRQWSPISVRTSLLTPSPYSRCTSPTVDGCIRDADQKDPATHALYCRNLTKEASTPAVDQDAAVNFIRNYYRALPYAGSAELRTREVLSEIAATGFYEHTAEELAFGARVAWRNSSRCIGRLYWRSLQVRDLRGLSEPDDIAGASVEHLRVATAAGRIRPVISVFAPLSPGRKGSLIRSDQLIRYAGYRQVDGNWVGDPGNAELTDVVQRAGWKGPGTPFDVLPIAFDEPDGTVRWFPIPSDAVLEIPVSHPDFAWFTELGLRWHALPAVSNMCLEIGGICYPNAPFSGWYMGSEIGARNLADRDRYDLLPTIAERMGLDTSSDRTLWRDRALVELNVAVLHSFDRTGVRMTDHHTESDHFLRHLAREQRAGRTTPADWTWIVPPISGGLTSVFHRYYNEDIRYPAFTYRVKPR
ncbi:nitric oxide synthase oxygenase [Streptomyces sp. Lzd4kr]|nr:nitric oxide synthase oxygenase [Streptomyces sp. Lzd4kr]